MLGLFWLLPIVLCLQILQVHSAKKRGIDDVDLSSMLLEERLPREIFPISYVLDVHPFPDDGYFKGRATINLEWQDETNKITIHADPDLVIYHSDLILLENSEPSRTIKILRSERDPERSWYIIHLRKPLISGSQAQLSMVFTGKLDIEAQEGLFRGSYENMETGETKYFVGSNFKPNFARKLFPCFDEPEYKAPFTVSVVRKSTMTTLSNMPLLRSDNLLMDPTWVRDYFHQSPPMATYSLGILVSDFESIMYEVDPENEKNFDAPIQIWGPPGYLEATQNFTELIYKAVSKVGDVLDIPYPLTKLDYVFLAEVDSNNWGLVFDRGPGIFHIRYNVVSQWIAHLITPVWWTDQVINDALGFYITMYTFSEFDEDQQEVEKLILQGVYAMWNEYSKSEPFDGSSREQQLSETTKAIMLFRMLNYTLGDTVLKQGLQRFMSEMKYKSYSESDIWNAITEQAHFEGILEEDTSVNEIASSWILPKRIPLLTVKRNYRDNSVTFAQKIYKRERPHLEEQSDYKWWIPIIIRTEDDIEESRIAPILWLREETARLTKIGKRDQFIIVNPDEIGPFPVNYDEKNWKLLSEYLQTEDGRVKIPAATRAKLLNDALNLAYAGELSSKTALDVTLFLNNEDSIIVWDRFFAVIDQMGAGIGDSLTVYEKFLRFVRHVVLTLYDRIEANSDEDEEQERSRLQATAKHTLCAGGHKTCIEEAQNSFDKWIEEDSSGCDGYTDSYSNACYVFQWGSDEEFELGLQRILSIPVDNETNSGNEHHLFTTLIGCASKPWKIEKMLNVSIFEQVEEFSDTNIESIFLRLAESSVGYSTLLEYLITNWDALKERFENKDELWNKLIETATLHFKTQDGLDAVSTLYSERSGEFGTAESIIEKSIKVIEEEVEWSNINIPVIEEWLDNYFIDHDDQDETDLFLVRE